MAHMNDPFENYKPYDVLFLYIGGLFISSYIQNVNVYNNPICDRGSGAAGRVLTVGVTRPTASRAGCVATPFTDAVCSSRPTCVRKTSTSSSSALTPTSVGAARPV